MPINYQTYVSSVEEKQLIQTLFPHTLSHLQFLSATQYFNLAEMATQQENSALSNVSDTMCQRLSVNDWKMDMATKRQEKSSLSNASETMCQRRLSVNDCTMDMATKKQEKSSLSNASETMRQRRLSVNDCTMDMATKKQEKSSLSNASETMCQRLSVNDCRMDMATKKQDKSSLSNASETMCQRLSVNDWTMDMATKKQDKSSLSNASETMCQRSSVNDWMVDMATKLEKADPSNDSGSGSCLYELLCSDAPSWNYQRDRRATGLPERMESFLRQSGNRSCADCGSPDPKWVSLSLGVLICIKCSGVHRNLGVHISKVLSLKLDDWTEEQVDSFVTMGGNIEANKKYEACIPVNLKKPKPDSSIDERFEFIRRKYELLQFLNSDEQMSCPFVPTHKRSSSVTSGANSAQDKKQYEKQQTRHRIGNAFRNSWGRKESEHKASKKSSSLAGMVEFVGLIMVNVVKGTNLAVRDMMSSDPYVILALGNQSVKTRVIKNNLNPVWNESLMLSIPQHIPPLKVIVYDKDTFTTDDFMGEAEIDIQPLVTAAKAYEKSTINESMQLGKWVASKENTLVKDGIISLVDGKVRQDISLRLQNVERGVLEIELECVPLTQ